MLTHCLIKLLVAPFNKQLYRALLCRRFILFSKPVSILPRLLEQFVEFLGEKYVLPSFASIPVSVIGTVYV